MSFSDDDLKRLKESLKTDETFYLELTTEQTTALLTRLEAAENCLEYVGHDNCDSKDVDRALKAWRKSRGW